MFGVYVVLSPRNGVVSRFTRGMKGRPLMTHEAVLPGGGPVSFDQALVDEFHDRPPEGFRVHHPTTPPPPPAGGTPVAVAVAA